MILTENQKIMIIVGLVIALLAALYFKSNKSTGNKTKTEHMGNVSSNNSVDNSASDSEGSMTKKNPKIQVIQLALDLL